MDKGEDFRAFGMVADGEVMVDVHNFNGYMCVVTDEMPIMITRNQAAKFFGLIDPECERRRIAGLAMQGFCADPSLDWGLDTMAKISVDQADALLAALEAK